ncbi:lytic murein transglycosylase [Plantactinospora sp. WMMB334]|uniref:lytic transglycosylase domain-containing protein n=1 Tax=Plantactinospora sp. WMMB334 TaxID=3404119 RepID=UPI003B924891
MPVYDGPLASSGAAPEPDPERPAATVPRPRAEADSLLPSGGPEQAATTPGPEPATTIPEPEAATGPGEPATEPAAEPGAATGLAAPATGPGEPATEPAAAPAGMVGTGPGTAAEPETPGGPGPEPEAVGSPEPEGAGKPEPEAAGGPGGTVIDLDVPATVPPAGRRRRIRVPFAHATSRWPSRQAVRDWSRRPSGRLTLPALLLFALVAATGAAGAFLLPATARETRPVEAGAATSLPPVEPTLPGLPPIGPDGLSSGLPSPPPFGTPSGVPAPPWNATGGRPSDVLAGWAGRIGPRVGVPVTAMQAYGYAEMRLAQSTPGCQLRWTTLAAIGQVESGHGRANGAVLGTNGIAAPDIIGLPLDGNGGRMRIMDTEDGQLDGDATYDRAVGPMQFIPTTWEEVGADADGDGVENPHSIDDAALAAGNYLCKGGRNLSVAADWWSAILSYNDVRPYAQSVFDNANRYGTDSKT